MKISTCSVRFSMKPTASQSPVVAIALWAMLFAFCASAGAQHRAKVPRIGFLITGSPSGASSRVEAFRQACRDLGYVEGNNLTIDYRYAAGRVNRLPDLAADLLRLNPDVIVAQGASAAHAAKNATRTVPIVMSNAADPVGTGLVSSLAQPGGNVTGLSDFNVGVITKRLELLKEVLPTASYVAVLLNPANPTNPLQLKHLEAVAPALRVKLHRLEIKNPEDIDAAFASLRKKEPVSAILVIGDPMFGAQRSRLIELTAKSRLPATWSVSDYVEAGGLMSYGTSLDDLHRRAATYVDKILKGAKPAELPVEQPTKFELVINLKTAKQIGLTIPPNVLARADRVIR
jgi:putative tryptophan/tyrosine transport system substrate-binding protein